MIPENRTILSGDVFKNLEKFSNDSVDCIITSPPYFALRDYSVKGQIGLESNYKEYLSVLQKFMMQCKRVLKPTGSCWINLGDTYADSGKGVGGKGDYKCKESFCFDKLPKLDMLNITRKSRFGIPERFYIQCIDDGWIARNHIPWIKNNAMPSSVKDRFTNKWESIFFFTKNPMYYFNLDHVRIKPLTVSVPFNVRVREVKNNRHQSKLIKEIPESENEKYDSNGIKKSNSKQNNTIGADGKPKKTYTGFNERYNQSKQPKSGKNPGDIFYINTKAYPEAHPAMFPIELPETILKCACPKDGIVLDPFFGAGTVAVAAEKLGLRWVGIELSEKYINTAKKRLEKFRNDCIEDHKL